MTGLDICCDCVCNRAMEFAKEHIKDKAQQEAFIRDTTTKIKQAATPERYPYMDTIWMEPACELLGVEDLYKEEKKVFHNSCVAIQDDLEATLSDEPDVLLAAFRLAAAGNIIDFACNQNLDLDYAMQLIDEVKSKPIDENVYNQYMSDLTDAKSLVYLLDNVGECVFDVIYMKKLKEAYPNLEITAVAKGGPISSDVTYKEALEYGIANYAKLISNGNNFAGTVLFACSNECKDAIEKADVILAKGMANFETFVASRYNAYYLFLCKCERMYCDKLNFILHDILFISDKLTDNTKYSKINWTYEL